MTAQPPSHEEVQRLADELDNNQYCPMRAGRTLRSLLADNARLSDNLKTAIRVAAEHVQSLSEERDQLRARIGELEKANRILEIKNAGTLANNLCPDCRDKQTGKPCLGCTIQTLERKNRERDERIAALEKDAVTARKIA